MNLLATRGLKGTPSQLVMEGLFIGASEQIQYGGLLPQQSVPPKLSPQQFTIRVTHSNMKKSWTIPYLKYDNNQEFLVRWSPYKEVAKVSVNLIKLFIELTSTNPIVDVDSMNIEIEKVKSTTIRVGGEKV